MKFNSIQIQDERNCFNAKVRAALTELHIFLILEVKRINHIIYAIFFLLNLQMVMHNYVTLHKI